MQTPKPTNRRRTGRGPLAAVALAAVLAVTAVPAASASVPAESGGEYVPFVTDFGRSPAPAAPANTAAPGGIDWADAGAGAGIGAALAALLAAGMPALRRRVTAAPC